MRRIVVPDTSAKPRTVAAGPVGRGFAVQAHESAVPFLPYRTPRAARRLQPVGRLPGRTTGLGRNVLAGIRISPRSATRWWPVQARAA